MFSESSSSSESEQARIRALEQEPVVARAKYWQRELMGFNLQERGTLAALLGDLVEYANDWREKWINDKGIRDTRIAELEAQTSALSQQLSVCQHAMERERQRMAMHFGIRNDVATWDTLVELASSHVLSVQHYQEKLAVCQQERDEARTIVANVNNEVIGSQGYFTTPSCVEAVAGLKADNNRLRQEALRLREAERAAFEAGWKIRKQFPPRPCETAWEDYQRSLVSPPPTGPETS